MSVLCSIHLVFFVDASVHYADIAFIAGQPRRHLLTTGWSVFVSSKKLVAGDAFIFLRYVVHYAIFLIIYLVLWTVSLITC